MAIIWAGRCTITRDKSDKADTDTIRFNLNQKDIRFLKEQRLEFSDLTVHSFRYGSGLAALEVENRRGRMVILPFHGQQIWDLRFEDRRLTMRTPVKEPKPTQDFLSNMGAFFFHCGMSAMGSPGPEDTHPIHGEMVNAPYRKAFIDAGEDDKGRFVGVGGEYEHSAAFGHDYLAMPYVRMYENETMVYISLRVINLKHTPMEFMYLAHLNFLPVDFGRLVYSAPYDKEHVRVRASFPSHMSPTDQLRDFVDQLVEDPQAHHVLDPGLTFDPEIVFLVDYLADEEGWAHSLHVHPDGSADYVRHKPSQLDTGVRWICRTPDQQALGMEAGTAGPEGYSAEKKKGKVKVLQPGDEFYCELVAGYLTKNEAQVMEQCINKIRCN